MRNPTRRVAIVPTVDVISSYVGFVSCIHNQAAMVPPVKHAVASVTHVCGDPRSKGPASAIPLCIKYTTQKDEYAFLTHPLIL